MLGIKTLSFPCSPAGALCAVLLTAFPLTVGRADEPQSASSTRSIEHDPETERQSFHLLPGFEVNLFAAEPMLANPIHMTWDPQGRLWVVCSWSYPHLKPGEEPNDKIIVLEDSDGDGRADRSTIFAEGLYVPTGLELGDGGVYVANAPDLLFFKDTDGDGRADVRRVVLTGFATEDNHHSISAWRWGPGGWLYFQEGTFMHSQVETPYGTVRLRYGGVFQFRPPTRRLRIFADYRASNPWGHMFDRWGQSILIDNPRLYTLAPLTANSRAKLAFQPSGSGTKQCGGEFTSGRHLPKTYRGEIWTNQYKTNTVARYRVEDDGAGFSITGLEPLLRSDSQSFRPVDLKIGPDGAAYILDWYNPLIGHMQHSFRDPRRDTTHGRVWRVTYKKRPLLERPELVSQSLPKLLEHLKDPEDWTRYQVKRVIYDRDPKTVAAALKNWVKSLDPAEDDFEHHRLEALWCFQTIGVVNEALLKRVLKSEDGQARAAAVRVVRYWHDRIEDPLALLETAVRDPHPRVRMEAVLSLGYVPEKRSLTIAVRALDQPTDRYILHALRLTVDGLQPHWVEAYRRGELAFDTPEHRNYALANLLTDESVQVLIELLNSGGVNRESVAGPAAAVAQNATRGQLEPLILTLAEHMREYATRGRQGRDSEVLARVLEALDQAARRRGVKPGGVARMVSRCFTVPDDSVQIAAARLVGAWKLTRENKRLKRFITSPMAGAILRRQAARSLAELGGRSNRAFLEELTEPDRPVSQRYLGVIGLAAADLQSAAPVAAGVLADPPQAADPTPVVSAFLRRRGGADLLASALAKSAPHADVSGRIRQHFHEVGVVHSGLVNAFGGGVSSESLEGRLLREDVEDLVIDVKKHGDAVRGERIFRRRDLACLSCHSIAGAGPKLGPDLAAVGSSSQPDYLVDALLRPSKVIKEFFESAVVVTREGRVTTGILAFKGEDEVVLRHAEGRGKELSIPAADVEEFVRSKKSLMPTGLANKLNSRQEFLDLTRFLMELGRSGPYAPGVKPIIRRWRVRQADREAEKFAFERPSVKVEDTGWRPAYAMVSGLLPLDQGVSESKLILLRAHVDVAHAGRVRLKINSIEGLKLWIDDVRISLTKKTVVDLAAGRRELTFLIDAGNRTARGLRVELAHVPGSKASYKVVSGP